MLFCVCSRVAVRRARALQQLGDPQWNGLLADYRQRDEKF